MFGRFIRGQERQRATRDTNRVVRPFEWGAEFVVDDLNGDDPRRIFERHTRDVMRHSEDFFHAPEVSDYALAGDRLTWTSGLGRPRRRTTRARALLSGVDEGGESERARPSSAAASSKPRRAVVVPRSGTPTPRATSRCAASSTASDSGAATDAPLSRGATAEELERADYLVCSNVGRTLQSVRQAVLDTRAAVAWLAGQGYERIGIVGTSIGSCTAFLAFAHDERIRAGVFNHVSGYFADVVWHGISTRHVRAGLEGSLTLEELREAWLPISPMPFAERLLKMPPRPLRFIAARHDLTFPADLSREVIARVKSLGVPLDESWLPCGHYTSGERPWVYIDGWKIVSFMRKHL